VKHKILAILKENPVPCPETRSAAGSASRVLPSEAHRAAAPRRAPDRGQTNRGYQLIREADILNATTLSEALAEHGLADYIQAVEIVDETDSTNEMAKRAAVAGAPGRSLFIARYQTVGRGRRGYTWVSQADLNLTFSLLLRPEADAREMASATLFAGFAPHRVLTCLPTSKKSGILPASSGPTT
jgi:hypothetical protein